MRVSSTALCESRAGCRATRRLWGSPASSTESLDRVPEMCRPTDEQAAPRSCPTRMSRSKSAGVSRAPPGLFVSSEAPRATRRSASRPSSTPSRSSLTLRRGRSTMRRCPITSRAARRSVNRRRSRRSASAGLAVALIGIGALAILIPSLTVPVGDPAITATTVPTPAHSATTATIDAVDAYTSCAEAWEALGRPVTAADDGFSPDFDADSDSIGCEDDPRTTTFNEHPSTGAGSGTRQRSPRTHSPPLPQTRSAMLQRCSRPSQKRSPTTFGDCSTASANDRHSSAHPVSYLTDAKSNSPANRSRDSHSCRGRPTWGVAASCIPSVIRIMTHIASSGDDASETRCVRNAARTRSTFTSRSPGNVPH